MTGKQCAILERNVGKSIDKIEESIKEGAKVGKVDNFYVEVVQKEIEKIRAELQKMEY